ncbi:PAS domain S-box protein, partial [bacterium]|nr:PAS domain S-box protein [bacterium]
ALIESEASLQATVSSMDDLLFILDRDGVFIDFRSPEEASRLYASPDFFLGKSFREVMPPPVVKTLDQAFREVISKKKTVRAEYTLAINGVDSWFEARFAPRENDKGQITGATVVVHEITEQKRAERELNESNSRFRDMALSTSDWLWEVDENGAYVFCSDKVLKVLGYHPEELIGKTPFDIMPPEEAERIGSRFQELAAQKAPIKDLENWNLHKDGHRVCLLTNGVPILDEKGNLAGYRGTDIDVTERKSIERALRNSEATLRATLESTGDGILVVDSEGRVVQTNDQFVKLWRIPQEVLDTGDDNILLGHVLDQLVDPQAFLDKVQQLYQSSEEDFDVLHFKDGRVYERFSSPLILNDEVAGRVWSFSDVTDRVQVEEELRRNKLMTDTANASILWIRRDGMLTDVNGAVCEMLGYTREELLTMSVFDFDKQYDRDRWAISWQETKTTAKSHSFSEHIRKDGQIIPVEIISNYIDYNGEEFQCCFVTDITRRKRNETVQSVLYEISEATGRTDSLVELLEVIQKQIGRLIDTSNFYVALHDEASGLYTFPYVVDAVSGDPMKIPPQDLKRSLTDYVRRRGEATLLLSEDIQALADAGEIGLLGEMAKIWMGVPLILSGRVIGVVGIQSYTNADQYTPQDKDLLSIVASSIAMAIERKQSEEDLAAANQMMRNVLDTIPVRVFWKDVNSVYLGCNELYAFDAGCDDSSEVIGKTDADLKWKSEAESFQATDRDIMATGIPRIDYLEPLYYPDGSRGWSQTSKIPLRNTNDQIVGVLGVYQDITDRIRAEEAVRHERDHAQRYLNIAGVILIALNTEGIITMINPKGCSILGYKQEELIGENWFDKCVPFDIRESTRAEFCTLLTGVKGNVGSFENPVLTASGERRLISWNDTLVRDDDGIVIGTLSSGEDITDRKRSEAILLQKEANLAEAQRIAKVGSWEYNLETDEIEASDELHRIYGLDPAHKVNRCGVFSLMTHPDDKDRVFASNEACNKNGKSIDMRYRIVRTDGEVRHVHEQAHVRLDQNGRPLHVFGTVQDITEQVNAEEERKSLESQLRRTQRLETIGTL